MANYCEYDMHVCGAEGDVNEFVSILQRKHNKRRLPDARIYSAEVYSSYNDADGNYVACIFGDCAWSVFTSMLYGKYDMDKGLGLIITTLVDESRILNLKIEVWSQEVGIGFQEHYLLNYGDVIDESEKEVDVYYFDQSEYDESLSLDEKFDAYKRENDIPENLHLYDFDDNGECIKGGFYNYGTFAF